MCFSSLVGALGFPSASSPPRHRDLPPPILPPHPFGAAHQSPATTAVLVRCPVDHRRFLVPEPCPRPEPTSSGHPIPEVTLSSRELMEEKSKLGSRTDIGWQHGVDVENNSKKVRDVEPCLTVPDDVKNKMQSIVDKLAKVADKRKRKSYGIDDSDDEDPLPKATDKGKMKMDTFSRSKKGSNFGSTQATINQMMKKELRDEACQEIARKSKKEELFTIDDLSSDDEWITEENDHIDRDDLDQINEVDGHDVEPIHLVDEEGSGNVAGANDISSIVHHANDGSDGDNDSDETKDKALSPATHRALGLSLSAPVTSSFGIGAVAEGCASPPLPVLSVFPLPHRLLATKIFLRRFFLLIHSEPRADHRPLQPFSCAALLITADSLFLSRALDPSQQGEIVPEGFGLVEHPIV
ncbi:hypothetical protein ZIOFF_047561 [Zingiber officinale]|uniref:Uncharacterized protein n=1 Tax=Zingiber officinale TaxID=94328 RepID=A0A8J5FPC2_ZINOF|nr:hypothetical protein ZIOFF_047561 [Zingiber officinale]